jgi:hypothetical protein
MSLNAVYTERNQLLSLVAKQAIALGFAAGVQRDQVAEPGWQSVVFVDLPSGQCSWHIHDSEMQWFDFLDYYSRPWDGHSTEEKYQRVLAATYPAPERISCTFYVENSGVRL